MHSNRVITITGPSMSGKTTAVQMMLESKRVKCEVIPKFKTRRKRLDDDSEVISVSSVPPECDLVYEQAGTHYGLSSSLIYDALKRGVSPIVILSDVRAIEDLRSLLGPVVTSLFIFREEPELRSMIEIASKRGVDDLNDTLLRLNKARAIYRIYIENIQLFDHVIINASGRRVLRSQVTKILGAMASSSRIAQFTSLTPAR